MDKTKKLNDLVKGQSSFVSPNVAKKAQEFAESGAPTKQDEDTYLKYLDEADHKLYDKADGVTKSNYINKIKDAEAKYNKYVSDINSGKHGSWSDDDRKTYANLANIFAGPKASGNEWADSYIRNNPGVQSRIKGSIRAGNNLPGHGYIKGLDEYNEDASRIGEAGTLNAYDIEDEGLDDVQTDVNNAAYGKQTDERGSNVLNDTAKDGGQRGDSGSGEALSVNKLPTKSKYQLKSIFQAYADGDFGEPGSSDAKHTRNMLVIDSLGKFAGNLGKDFANLAAAYTGGAVNNERDKSMWQEHEDAMRQGYTEANAAGIDNSRENRRARSELAGISAQELGNMIQRDRYGTASKVRELLNSGDVNPRSKEYKDLADAYNVLVSGGTFNQSMLQQLFSNIAAITGL